MGEFIFRGVTFVVKRLPDGRLVYKDKAHLGGPWSDYLLTISNKSFSRVFKNLLYQTSTKM